ncbi:DUF3669 domain containing protein [Pyrenophora teres f. maculata]|nr:DUF3669 domain containing protein [Pyrenophora teres f. maculata]
MSSPPPVGSPAHPQGRKRGMIISEASGSTDYGSRSASLAVAMERSLQLEQQLAQEADATSAEQALQRMLSLRSVISTTSSFAERQQGAVGKVTNFREIGKGSIGVIFEHPGTIRCYKLPLLDDSTKIWNNYAMHTGVYEGFSEARKYLHVAVRIPEMYWFANEQTSGFWDENLNKFPFTTTFPKKSRDALCMERVLPLPRPLRHLLIEKYCMGDKEEAKSYGPNQDCLVRPILGRRRFGSGKIGFSLRNFRLHLDQFEELNLNIEEYLYAMADAMATLHCIARVDAMDIEFVIGSTPSEMQSGGACLTSADIKKMKPGSSTFEMVSAKDFTNREICLWALDFDACRSITIDPVGVRAAVKAFMDTEAYCPRPSQNTEDHKLWRSFGKRYIDTAAKLGAHPNFATSFLDGVEAAVKAARAGRDTTAPSTPRSSQNTMISTGESSRGRGRGHSQSGGGRGSSTDRRSNRDLNASWRK